MSKFKWEAKRLQRQQKTSNKRKDMLKEDLKFLLRSCLSLGLARGLLLFARLKLGRLAGLRLPGIRHPFSLRAGTSDIPTFGQVFFAKEYDLELPRAPQIIIDGGANIGLFTLLMKNRYPEATIICIEPDRDNFRLLQQNTAAYPGISCENCGLWNRDATLKVYDKYDTGKWGMVVEEDPFEGDIPALAMGTLLKKYGIQRIDLLKLDIETSEKQLFASHYADWLPLVDTLIIELHDWMEPGCSRPFFHAINECFADYTLAIKGENIIIENKSQLLAKPGQILVKSSIYNS
jgi:FkbM family methyltransferase